MTFKAIHPPTAKQLDTLGLGPDTMPSAGRLVDCPVKLEFSPCPNSAWDKACALDQGGQTSTQQPDVEAVTGTTYYVSTSGTLDSRGTKESPWATLQQAIGVVQPGDKVIVGRGTHKGVRFPKLAGKDGEPPKGSVAGTAKAPIVVMADPDVEHGGVVITGTDTDKGGFTLEAGCDYVHIVGFTIENTKEWGVLFDGTTGNRLLGNTIRGVTGHSGVSVVGTDVVIAGNTVTDTHKRDSKSTTSGHGVTVSDNSKGVSIINNDIRDNEFTGIQITSENGIVEDLVVEENFIGGNGGNGINGDGSVKGRFQNNVIAKNERNGIVLYSIDIKERDPEASSRDNQVANNTIYQPNGSALKIGKGGSIGDLAANNLLGGGINMEGEAPGFVAFGNFSDLSPDVFVDLAAGDYRLAPNGPAFGAGVPSRDGFTAPKDADGRSPIGAFKFRQPGSAPMPTSPSPAGESEIIE